LKYRALKELILTRTREFYREPEAVFWVYVFPVLLMGGLGVAFPGDSDKEIRVNVVEGPRAETVATRLSAAKNIRVERVDPETARQRHAAGKVELIVEAADDGYRYLYDPTRTGAEAIKIRVNDLLQSAEGRKDPVATKDVPITETGSRYVDWLIPGILGMNIMGGGMWGLGFVTVDLRMRKLLKRFVATPMRRGEFLFALVASRLFFLIPETVAVLLIGHFLFGLEIRGSVGAVALLSLVGSLAFAGIGLLVASRTDKIETVSGLINLVMLPMWLVSGIFFASERFPDKVQPLIQALPLTQLNNSLRAVILEGGTLSAQWMPLSILAAYGAISFFAALRIFQWK
jgi:ABC-2 type transport system permease protein